MIDIDFPRRYLGDINTCASNRGPRCRFRAETRKTAALSTLYCDFFFFLPFNGVVT